MGQPNQQRDEGDGWGTWKTIEGLVRTCSMFWTTEKRLGLAAKLEGLARELRADVEADGTAAPGPVSGWPR
jgi:hypothetical protein